MRHEPPPVSADRIGDGSDSSDGIVRLREAPNRRRRVRRDTVPEIQGGFLFVPGRFVSVCCSAPACGFSKPVGVIYSVESACQINMVKKLANSSKGLAFDALMFFFGVMYMTRNIYGYHRCCNRG